MKVQTRNVTGIVAAVVLGLIAVAFSMSAEAGKVEVCHSTNSESNPTVEIVVSENALETHLEHGDTLFDPETGCGGGGEDPDPV